MRFIMSIESKINEGKTMLSDAIITTKIKAALLKSSLDNVNDIHVVTQEGVVTLSGKIPTLEDMNSAIEIVESVEGVKKLVSKLKLDDS
jgi:hyperosmotically inducible protein